MDLKFDFYLFLFSYWPAFDSKKLWKASPRLLWVIYLKKERKKGRNSKDFISCQVNLLCSMFFIRALTTLVNFVLLILKELRFPQNCILNFLYLSMRSSIVILVKQITKHCFTVIYDPIWPSIFLNFWYFWQMSSNWILNEVLLT